MEFEQDASQFWGLTYREIDTVLRGVMRRRKREHNDAAWLAWHTAFLTAYAPSKARKFWKLEKLLWKEPPKRQSLEEMRSVARRWVEAIRRRSARHEAGARSEGKSNRNAEDDGDEPARKS